HKHAPYVLTKPFHASQKLIEKDNYGITISLDVQHNFELEKEILAIGDGIKVIAPTRLRRKIKDRLAGAIDLYETEISDSGLITATKRLEYKGSAVLNYVYTKREVKKLKNVLDSHMADFKEKPIAIRSLLLKIPELRDILFNKNLNQIIRTIDKDAFLSKAIYFDKPTQSNWYVTWHQDATINVKDNITAEGFSGWTKKENIHSVCPPLEIQQNTFTLRIHLDDTDEQNGALQILAGSHKKRLNDSEIQLITQNCIAQTVEIGAGGVHLMKPLLLHASSKTRNQKRRRVLHLEFSSTNLPENMEWLEKEEI
ncbi:MAG: phytanoyl-CoA dioxygenase family protein, partial [Flavobacteriaceae bacterium]|nr:phytanoyl-CoA dioxygenase family protein [Flavobacteriaceae bacterium]